jgi:hypothetical protein
MKNPSTNITHASSVIAFLLLVTQACSPKTDCEACKRDCPSTTAVSGGGCPSTGAAGTSGGGASGTGPEVGGAGTGGMAPAGPQGLPYVHCNIDSDCNNTALQNAGFDSACLQSGSTCGAGSMCYAYLRSGGQCNKVNATNTCKKSNGTTGTALCGAGGAACGWGACN